MLYVLFCNLLFVSNISWFYLSLNTFNGCIAFYYMNTITCLTSLLLMDM